MTLTSNKSFYYHDRSCLRSMLATSPALADVGTASFLAHRRQLQLSELIFDFVEIFT